MANKDKVQLKETLNKMKLEQRAAVDKAHEEGYNLALEEEVEQFSPIRAQLYQIRYNLSLKVVGIPTESVHNTHVEIPKDFKDTPSKEEAGNNDDAEVTSDPMDGVQN